MENLKCNWCQKEKHPDAFELHQEDMFARWCDACRFKKMELIATGLHKSLTGREIQPDSYTNPKEDGLESTDR